MTEQRAPTDRELGVLTELAINATGDEWLRPMDFGGRDGSHHSGTLRRLMAKGYVMRRQRRGLGYILGFKARSFEYRITVAGTRWLKPFDAGDEIDAPDGATLGGYTRVGDTWQPRFKEQK